MGRSVIIIGAGIAGLSAGCYARMNGYDSTIYEMHTIPGGLCTSWKRGDYIFDGSINWLPGSAPDGMFYPLWREVGVIQRCSFIYQDVYCHYAHESGETVVLYYDPVRLRQELLSHSPEDSEAIGEFCGLIETLKGFSPNVAKAQELFSIADYMRMMPDLMLHSKKYRTFLKYGKVTMSEFASKFKSPLLSSMLKFIWGEGHPIALFLAMMAWNSSKTAGYPEGGSLKVAEAMEGRYLSLGGKVCYKSRVESIIVKNGKAAGVKLADGSEQAADIVVSAADGFTTLNRMLGGAYSTDCIKQWYGSSPTFPPYIQVSLGVARDMRGEPGLIHQRLSEPITIAGKPAPYMIIQNYAFDPALAPGGKTALAVRFFTDYSYWERLYADREAYREEKESLAYAVIHALNGLYPGLEKDVEVCDVATPATYVRYTGTWRGATMSWLPTTANFSKNICNTLPGLNGFYMAGQWLTPGGGVPTALKSGRDAVQFICRADGKKFTATDK